MADRQDLLEVRTRYLVVSLRALVVALTVVSLVCLAALVVVSAAVKADALSTVALSLAILAFVVQLIVFIVQTSRAEDIYARTEAVLARIEERTLGTQSAVTGINARLVEAMISKAFPDAPQVARRVAEDIIESTTSGTGLLEPPSAEDFLPRRPGPDDARIRRLLTTYPRGDKADHALARLRSLSAPAQNSLWSLAQDDYHFRRPDSTSYDPGLPAGVYSESELGNLVQIVKAPAGNDLVVLTDEGRDVARLLTARGTPPARIADELKQIKSGFGMGDEELEP